MKKLIATAITVLVTSPAWANDIQSQTDQMLAKSNDMVVAREIGQIVGTADLCGYTLDADKVAAFVSERLAAMEPTARAMFQTGSGAHKMRLMEMGELERKVACATQAKVAAKYGFMP